MKIVKVSTQAELEQALKDAANEVWLVGSGEFTVSNSSQVTACGSSQVTAYGSSQVTAYGSSQVTAYGSSQVTAYGSSQVTACDSSQVTAYNSSQVTACDSSQVTAYGSSQVTAYGSSQVTACDSSQVTACDSSQVTAYNSSQVTACGSSQVRASKQVAVTISSGKPKVCGGVQILYKHPTTIKGWLDSYSLKPAKGVVVLYKGVDSNYNSEHGTSYAPGSAPEATDWDGGKHECGGGLHFSPDPAMTLKFAPNAKRFIACPVKVSDIRSPQNGDTYPDKVKAKKVSKPGCYEVDIFGKAVKQQ